MHRQQSRILSSVGVALAAMLMPYTSAFASVPHADVVIKDPVDYTPQLQADAAVARPRVDALAQSDDAMFAGGLFRTVVDAAGMPLQVTNVMSFSATSGALNRSFAPKLDGRVYALEAAGDDLYVGGDFSTVNGTSRRALVKLDGATGAVDPLFNANFPGGRINDIELVNGRLIVAGSSATKLMALDPATGQDTGYINLGIRGKIEGSWGTVSVYRFAVNASGTQLAAVGNFTTVAGDIRHRAFLARLDSSAASLDPWYYNSLTKPCASTSAQRQAYLSDVDFAPDGTYFVVTSTGSVPRLTSEIGETVCDAVARFDVGITSPARPVWINYTGGDTVWSVAATGAAVYVQGHFEYLDNPEGNNSAGPGAVLRRGVGAVDPVTGKALPWNPAAPSRIGGRVIHVDSTGVWFGSDNVKFDGENHRGLAFTPLP